MLVNENRLNLADARARQYLARQMEQFFFGQDHGHPINRVDADDAGLLARLKSKAVQPGRRDTAGRCGAPVAR
jgi:hypothetical protein